MMLVVAQNQKHSDKYHDADSSAGTENILTHDSQFNFDESYVNFIMIIHFFINILHVVSRCFTVFF